MQAKLIRSTTLLLCDRQHSYLARHRNAAASFPEIPRLIYQIRSIFTTWKDELLLSPPAFEDSLSQTPIEDRTFIIKQLSDQVEALCTTVDRESGRVKLPSGIAVTSSNCALGEGQIETLSRNFRGPGGRHDNDQAIIQLIQIPPTHQELLSAEVSFYSFLPRRR